MISQAISSSSGAGPHPSALSMWECLWSTMHRNGWRMSHFTIVDETTGGIRHQVRAHRKGDELICSAPTMGVAMQVVFAESRVLPET